MRCSSCGHLTTVEACEIVGLVGEKLLVICPNREACGTSFCTPLPGPVSPVFQMLHDFAEQLSSLKLEEYEMARLALDTISDQAKTPLELQFVRDLNTRMVRSEEMFKVVA